MIWQAHTHTITGRENQVIFYCWHCMYRLPPVAWPLQQYAAGDSRCDRCRRALSFMAYEAGPEEVDVKLEIGYLPKTRRDLLNL